MVRFSDLSIGQEFDFIGDDRMFNSFYERCTKRSARTYTWEKNGERYKSEVGSIYVPVYHVGARR